VPADTRRKYDDTAGRPSDRRARGVAWRAVPVRLPLASPPAARLLQQTIRRTARDELLLVICGRVTQHRLQHSPADCLSVATGARQTYGDPKQQRPEREGTTNPTEPLRLAAVTPVFAPAS